MPDPTPSAADLRTIPGMPPAAGLGRRVVGVLLDWALCQLIAVGLLGFRYGDGGAQSLIPLGVFVLENLLLVSTLGSTVGHRLVGLRVAQVRRGQWLVQVLTRTALLALFFPAVLSGRDGRGYHDVLAGTTILRKNDL